MKSFLSFDIFTKIFAMTTIMLSNHAIASNNVLLLGDSLSSGHGIDKSKSWTYYLSEHLKKCDKKLINASISGETTTGALERVDQLTEEYKPGIIMIQIGGNDGLRATPINRIKTNIIKLIEAGKKTTDNIILIGTTLPPNYGSFI